MLNLHDEFNESLNRKIKIVARGEKITSQAMNPVMIKKVADVIRQLDDANDEA
jgi:hypothetical protein